MNWTDTFILITLIILILSGLHQGFLRSLIGPIGFVVGSVIAYLIYIKMQNMILAIAIAMLGPPLLAWGLKTLLKIFYEAFDHKPGLISRIGGAIVNVAWTGGMVALCLLLMAFIPFDKFGLKAVQADMNRSTTYKVLRKFIPHSSTETTSVSDCLSGLCNMDEKELQALAKDKDIQELKEDPRIQKLINDPQIVQAVEAQDYVTLLKHPGIMELAKDPELLKKAFAVFGKIKEKSGK